MISRDNKAVVIILLVMVMIGTPILSAINQNGNFEVYSGNDLTGKSFQYQRFKGNIDKKYDYYGYMKVDTGWEYSYFIEEEYEKYIAEIMVGSIVATKDTKDTFYNINKFSENQLNNYLESIEEAIRLDYKIDNEVYKKDIIEINKVKYAIIQFDINDKGNYFYFGFTTSKDAERMIMVRTSDSIEDNESEFLKVVSNIEFNNKNCDDKTNIPVKIENGVFSRGEWEEDVNEVK